MKDATVSAAATLPVTEPKREPPSELPPLPEPVRMSSDQAYLGYTADQMHDYARAVERVAYERAAQECDPHEDDDRIDRQIKREIAERIRALWRK